MGKHRKGTEEKRRREKDRGEKHLTKERGGTDREEIHWRTDTGAETVVIKMNSNKNRNKNMNRNRNMNMNMNKDMNIKN